MVPAQFKDALHFNCRWGFPIYGFDFTECIIYIPRYFDFLMAKIIASSFVYVKILNFFAPDRSFLEEKDVSDRELQLLGLVATMAATGQKSAPDFLYSEPHFFSEMFVIENNPTPSTQLDMCPICLF